MKRIKMGVIGLGQRGSGLMNTIFAFDNVDIIGVSDLYQDRIDDALKRIKEKKNIDAIGYLNYQDLLNSKDIEAVLIATSWETHVDITIASLKAKKITAVEVSGAYDIEDCWMLVRAYEETKTPIMFLENCCFDKFELLSTSLYRNGKLGEVVYCHGAYAHELRDEILGGHVDRHYRLDNYIHRNAENYPTHELGPICKLLNVNRGNRLLTISSISSKAVSLKKTANEERCKDKNLKNQVFNQGDIVISTITTENGEVITLRLDTTLPRYYSREFTVRGTDGMCSQDGNMVLFETDENMHRYYEPVESMKAFMNSADKYSEYLPDEWKNITEEELKLGHGGMDYIEFKVFFDCVLNNKEMPIDIYDMALWLSITPLSMQSIKSNGLIKDIPDFTRGKYLHRESKDVLNLPKIIDDKKETINPLGRSRG